MKKKLTSSWDELLAKTLESSNARAAYDEIRLRQRLAKVIRKEMDERSISIREMAKKLDTSVSQIQRLLNEDIGGSLTLLTVVKAANALGLHLTLDLAQEESCDIGEEASWEFLI